MEYDSGNTDEGELDFTSSDDNVPPEDGHTYGDDDVDESVSETKQVVLISIRNVTCYCSILK
jgi:hypothetical protein